MSLCTCRLISQQHHIHPWLGCLWGGQSQDLVQSQSKIRFENMLTGVDLLFFIIWSLWQPELTMSNSKLMLCIHTANWYFVFIWQIDTYWYTCKTSVDAIAVFLFLLSLFLSLPPTLPCLSIYLCLVLKLLGVVSGFSALTCYTAHSFQCYQLCNGLALCTPGLPWQRPKQLSRNHILSANIWWVTVLVLTQLEQEISCVWVGI